jgi:predicted lipoprotein with Yx(FWY)xxD motif
VTRLAIVVVGVIALAAGGAFAIALTRSPDTKPHRAAVRNAPDVGIGHTKLGRILVDRRGHTLYLFRSDRHGESACYDTCARVWPPALAPRAPRVGSGLSAAKLTTTTRRDHRLQLVYNGHPLYAMSGDTRPGQTAGEGFLGTWFVVSPDGHEIVAPGTAPSNGY